ncbi:MAG: hypothetical protein ACRENP_07910 [Longimicrobiales bacterium]
MTRTNWLDELVLVLPLNRWLPGSIRAQAEEVPQPVDRKVRIVGAAKQRAGRNHRESAVA